MNPENEIDKLYQAILFERLKSANGWLELLRHQNLLVFGGTDGSISSIM